MTTLTYTGSKSCSLDPLPTWLMKECIDGLLPVITRLVNYSLQQGHVPQCMKVARVCPIIKKANADPEVLSNYRPISNLSFVSKLIERAVSDQLQPYLIANNLYAPRQSSYRPNHSTETALLRVQNDLLRALDDGAEAALVLLDLSAAFDTIDHNLLLQRLASRYGITGTVNN